MSNAPSENPYAVTFEDPGPTPEQLNYVRNIDAICVLYLLMGFVGALAGGGLMSNGNPWIGLPLAISGVAAALSSVALRRRKRWGVPMLKLVSIVHLLYVPIGTILGLYFLRNVEKVRHLLS